MIEGNLGKVSAGVYLFLKSCINTTGGKGSLQKSCISVKTSDARKAKNKISFMSSKHIYSRDNMLSISKSVSFRSMKLRLVVRDPLRHSSADRKIAKDTLVRIQSIVVEYCSPF